MSDPLGGALLSGAAPWAIAAASALVTGAVSFLYRGPEHPAGQESFGDILPYALAVGEGLLLLKDGSLMVGFALEGRDVVSEGEAEVEAAIERIGAAVGELGEGVTLHLLSLRRQADPYPEPGALDGALAVIDTARARRFDAEDQYESELFASVTWRPPRRTVARLEGWFVSGGEDGASAASQLVAGFRRRLDGFAASLGRELGARRLDRAGLARMLRWAVLGSAAEVEVPPAEVEWSAALLNTEVEVGFEFRRGDRWVAVATIEGYPERVRARMGTWIHRLAHPVYVSHRLRVLDRKTAGERLDKLRSQWFGARENHRTWLASLVNDGAEAERIREVVQTRGAMARTGEVRGASEVLESGGAFVEHSSAIWVDGPSPEVARARLAAVLSALEGEGLHARAETVGAFGAYLGALPGVCDVNPRRALQLASAVGAFSGALVAPWLGTPRAERDTTVMVGRSGGQRFRFRWDDEHGVRHGLVVGRSGGGKSALLALAVAQGLRDPDLVVTLLDVGGSQEFVCRAAGGRYVPLALGGSSDFGMSPLAWCDDREGLAYAVEWIETIAGLGGAGSGGSGLEPDDRSRITEILSDQVRLGRRSLGGLVAQLPAGRLRTVLADYARGGLYGELFDRGSAEGMERVEVYELGELLEGGARATGPAVMLLMERLRRRILAGAQSGRRGLLVIEEAHRLLDHEVLRGWIERAIRMSRKQGLGVVLVTQSLSELVEARGEGRSLASALLSSIGTRIYLPDRGIEARTHDAICEQFGLGPAMRRELASAPKYSYLITQASEKGTRARRVSFELGAEELALLTGDEAHRQQIRRLWETEGSDYYRHLEGVG